MKRAVRLKRGVRLAGVALLLGACERGPADDVLPLLSVTVSADTLARDAPVTAVLANSSTRDVLVPFCANFVFYHLERLENGSWVEAYPHPHAVWGCRDIDRSGLLVVPSGEFVGQGISRPPQLWVPPGTYRVRFEVRLSSQSTDLFVHSRGFTIR